MMDAFSPVQGRWDKSANKLGNRWGKQSSVDKAQSALSDVWESKLWAICFGGMRDFCLKWKLGKQEKTREMIKELQEKARCCPSHCSRS